MTAGRPGSPARAIRRSRFAAAVLACSAAILPIAACAQAFPAKPLRVIIPFQPGSTLGIEMADSKFTEVSGGIGFEVNHPKVSLAGHALLEKSPLTALNGTAEAHLTKDTAPVAHDEDHWAACPACERVGKFYSSPFPISVTICNILIQRINSKWHILCFS